MNRIVVFATFLLPALVSAVQAQEVEPVEAPEAVEAPQAVEAPEAVEAPQAVEAPEAVEAPQADAPSFGYHKGFFIDDKGGAFSLKTQGRVQSRLTVEKDDGGDMQSHFAVQRARLKMSGHAHSKAWKYLFQMDLGKGAVSLKDFYIEHQFGDSEVRLRTGQWKRPFSRQQINSSGSLELVDRAITDKGFHSGRDIGIAVHNNYEKSPGLEWVVGLFNGSGDKSVFVPTVDADGTVTGGKFTNVPGDFQPVLVARVGHNSGGIAGYKEADFAGGPLRYGVGASALIGFDADGEGKAPGMAELDFVVKANGVSATGGVYYSTAQDGDSFSSRTTDSVGGHIQAGYLLGKKYQPVARFALVDPDGADNHTMELTGGFSVYLFKHSLKWQTDLSAFIEEGTDGNATNLQGRTQLQLAF